MFANLYQELFEHSLDGVLVTHPDGRILRANPSACRLLGRTEAEVVAAGRTGLVVDDARVRELVARRAGGAAVQGEISMRRRDGSPFPVELTTAILPVSDDGPIAYVIFRDISARRALEDALREREHLLAESQRIAHVGTWIWELDHDRLRWSEETYRVWGVDPATFELAPESFYALIHPDDRGAMQAWAGDCIAGKHPGPLRLRALAPDGTVRVLEGRGEYHEAEGLRPRRMEGTVQDVTDDERAGEAVRESQAMLKGITDAIPEPIFMKDRQSRWLFANPATLAAVGKELAEVLGRSDEEIYADPAVGRALVENDRRVMESGRMEVVEETVGTPAGPRTFLATKAPYRDASGAVVGLVGAAVDVTGQREASRALQRQHGLLEAIVNGAEGIVIFALDRSLRYTAFNENHRREMRRAWGVEIAVGDAILDKMTLPALREAARHSMERALAGESFTEEAHQPGAEADYELSWGPVRDLHGEVTGLVAFVRDVTARHRAEAERERLATAIAQAAEAVVVTDAQAAITYVNPAFEAITGWSRAEVLGRNPRILQSGAHDPGFYRELWDAISSGHTWKGRLVNRRKDGTTYTEEATISPVRDAAGDIVAYVAVKRDVSRDLALEEQLRQSQKMEGIGRLAGGIAHDFNNLLTVISGSAQLALEGIQEGDPLREELLEIDGAASRAATLTRRLLAFGRKRPFQPVRVELDRVVEGMEGMLRRIVGEDVELERSLAPGLDPILADAGQLEQVLLNLVVNARDAMPRGGRIAIGTSAVFHGEAEAGAHPGSAPGPHVRLTVADTGVGMDQATLSHLFEPFFTTKEPGKGTGLGLSTVYGIVRQCQGTIAVTSEPGRGTTFQVDFPVAPGVPAPAADLPPLAERAHPGETVLVVEDDAALGKVAERILSGAGFRVLVAASGGEALVIAEAEPRPVDLVLSDVVLPHLSGPETVARLGAVRPGFRVLYMTGHSQGPGAGGPALERDARVIWKPFGPQELLAAVRAAIDARA